MKPNIHLNLRGKNLTVLLDSWAWIEYFRNGPKASLIKTYVEGDFELFISTISIAEVFRYLLQFEQKPVAERLTKAMIQRSVSLPVTGDIAWSAAEFKHKNKWGLGDALIYATAHFNSLVVVTGDSDFKNAAGVEYLGE